MKSRIHEAWFPVDFSFCLSGFAQKKYGLESQSCLHLFYMHSKRKEKKKKIMSGKKLFHI